MTGGNMLGNHDDDNDDYNDDENFERRIDRPILRDNTLDVRPLLRDRSPFSSASSLCLYYFLFSGLENSNINSRDPCSETAQT